MLAWITIAAVVGVLALCVFIVRKSLNAPLGATERPRQSEPLDVPAEQPNQDVQAAEAPRRMHPLLKLGWIGVAAFAAWLFFDYATWRQSQGRSLLTGNPLPVAAAPYSMAAFERIQHGMDLADVVRILGSRGELLSSTDVAGHRSEMYIWTNPDGTNLTVLMSNGAVMSKAQFGLRR